RVRTTPTAAARRGPHGQTLLETAGTPAPPRCAAPPMTYSDRVAPCSTQTTTDSPNRETAVVRRAPPSALRNPKAIPARAARARTAPPRADHCRVYPIESDPSWLCHNTA